MTKTQQLVAEVIVAADCELVGRVRLQKVFYLLEHMGLGSGLKFSYHHYGPYSRDLDEAVDAAKAFTSVKEITQHRVSDGAAFSRFIVEDAASVRLNGHVGAMETDTAKAKISAMKAVSSTVIELAATIHWLVNAEKIGDWRPELVKRKGVKTQGGRTEQALGLLERLDLAKGIPA